MPRELIVCHRCHHAVFENEECSYCFRQTAIEKFRQAIEDKIKLEREEGIRALSPSNKPHKVTVAKKDWNPDRYARNIKKKDWGPNYCPLCCSFFPKGEIQGHLCIQTKHPN